MKEIFKAYDIRGVYPTEINTDIAYKIGKAFAAFTKAKKVALGKDVRPSGIELWEAAAKGLTEMGVDVVDIGIISTDMLYHAVASLNLDGGMTITGSHNPRQFNGFKLVGKGAEPISADSGLLNIRDLVLKNDFITKKYLGKIEVVDITDSYIEKIFSFVDVNKIKPLKVVVNPNFGSAGKIIEKIAKRLNIELIALNFEPDGNFPKGRPDPLIPELRLETSELVKSSGADMGVAWDSDADRIFWYDEKGRFIDGCYEGSVLSQIILKKHPGEKVVHDIRLIWAAENIIKESGGIPLVNKAGHSFIKERMRRENAILGFENSAHIFFRDYYYCDNGIIPWVMIMEEMSETGKKLSEIVDPIRFRFPISEEVNFSVKNPEQIFNDLENAFPDYIKDYTEGISFESEKCRFNVRMSNTGETLIRLNVEAVSRDVLDPMKAEIISIIKKDLAEI